MLPFFASGAFAQAPPETPDAWAELTRDHPDVAEALAAHAPDPDERARAAAVLNRADPRLVELLLPSPSDGPVADRRGEDGQVDLESVELWTDGTVLHGRARGPGVAQNGVWIDLDLGEGPAADLQLGFGRGWRRATALDGGNTPSEAGPYPVLDGDQISFSFDLGARAEGPVGSGRARVRSLDGTHEDMGPIGIFGTPSEEAIEVLLALSDAGPVADADLAVALSVTFGTLRPLVADAVVGTVDADAVAWLRYGESLDGWLEGAGAEWRFGTLDAFGKLTWAWPAAQAVVYGAVPLAAQKNLLDAEQYRFVAPNIATLTALRDRAPLHESAADTARAVDQAIESQLRYRTHATLMDALCRSGRVPEATCEGWRVDAKAGADLGLLSGVAVPLHEGVSASMQAAIFARTGGYVGDCATQTALVIATLQALGIPAIGMGWAGEDYTNPTHDVPLWYDGVAFRGTQRGPSQAWATDRAFVYITLPGVHPENAYTLGQEPGGWSRGGSVAGGWTTYREVERLLREGLPGSVVGGWVDTEAAGGWPTW